MSRTVLGDEHPDTLSSMNNLASTLRALGDFGKARALYREALSGFEKLLGIEHPNTQTVASNLEVLETELAEST